MGAWGVAIFSDDLAADIRSDFKELIGDGLTPSQATERLKAEYASSLDDPGEMSVFWIALAMTQWKLGRLEEQTKTMALKLIDDDTDLARWEEPQARTKRRAVLEKARAELMSPPPSAKPVRRTVKESNEWQIGETIGFRLLSGKWTLFRVIGHHTDKGGRFAVCELIDWVGETFPSAEQTAKSRIRRQTMPPGISQFVFQEPRKKNEQSRVVRLRLFTAPQQTVGGYTALVWPYVDEQLREIFGLR